MPGGVGKPGLSGRPDTCYPCISVQPVLLPDHPLFAVGAVSNPKKPFAAIVGGSKVGRTVWLACHWAPPGGLCMGMPGPRGCVASHAGVCG